MRTTFIQSLMSLRRQSDEVFLLVGDLGYSVIEPFQTEFPESFYNIGVAEQNMAGIAAGIASEGNQVFTYSIGNFNTFRCAEQIRNDIDYHNLPVCTVCVGGGVAYGNMGYSHHAIQDYALMRSFPNMLICAPSCPLETKLCMELLVERRGPAYLRLHKAGEPDITACNDPLIPGVPRLIAGNKNCPRAILTTGFTAQGVIDKVKKSDKYALFSMPAWGMRFRDPIQSFASHYQRIITLEDHLMDGGFGSWVLESLVGTIHVSKIQIKSLPLESIGKVGKESYIHQLYGLFDFD
jgi:transketolase